MQCLLLPAVTIGLMQQLLIFVLLLLLLLRLPCCCCDCSKGSTITLHSPPHDSHDRLAAAVEALRRVLPSLLPWRGRRQRDETGAPLWMALGVVVGAAPGAMLAARRTLHGRCAAAGGPQPAARPSWARSTFSARGRRRRLAAAAFTRARRGRSRSTCRSAAPPELATASATRGLRRCDSTRAARHGTAPGPEEPKFGSRGRDYRLKLFLGV